MRGGFFQRFVGGVEVSCPQLLTSGRIAAMLGEPIGRVSHILRSHPDIVPAAMAGNTRLFDRDALARIRHEINRIDARRAGREVVCD